LEKLVSIVLPVYNGEKYLSQAIESILNQTYHNFELIIVNDASTDSSEKVILKYSSEDERIVYLKNNENLKLPASLNKGFARARGEYYTWTSDDNVYHTDAIEKMVEYLESDSDVGMISCGMNLIDEESAFVATWKQDRSRCDLLLYNNIGACFLYRASIAKDIGKYRTDLFLVEDYDYWLRLSRKYRIDYCNCILYDYRHHKHSLTLSKKNEVLTALERYQWDNLKLYEALHIPEDELFRFYDYIRRWKYRDKGLQRRGMIIWFALKHKNYIRWYIKNGQRKAS